MLDGSLPFRTGLLIAGGRYLHLPLWLMCVLISAAAVLGDQFGYAFGRRFGSAVFRSPNSRLFKQENLTRAAAFFDKYGARSVVVVVSLIPVIIELVRSRRGAWGSGAESAEPARAGRP